MAMELDDAIKLESDDDDLTLPQVPSASNTLSFNGQPIDTSKRNQSDPRGKFIQDHFFEQFLPFDSFALRGEAHPLRPDDPVDKMHKCDMCEKSFKRKAHLHRHYLMHTGEKPYQCPICHAKFTRSERRKHHMRVHHPEMAKKEDADDDSFQTKPMVQCDICFKEFKTNSSLQMHRQVHLSHELPNKTYKCGTCDKEFSRRDNLIRHNQVHNNFYSTAGASAEEATGSLQDECVDPLEIVNVTSLDEDSFGDIVMGDEDETILDDDGFGENQANGEDELNDVGEMNGESEVNGTDMNSEAKHKTIELLRMSQTKADAELLSMGGVRQKVMRPKLTEEEAQTLTCNICRKTLAQKYQLMRHKLTHLDIKPYKCMICTRTFARREHLKHHLNTHRKNPGHGYENLNRVKEEHRNIQSLKLNQTINTYSSQTPTINHENGPVATRNRLLADFKRFAFKMQNQCSISGGDFYEQCFNYASHLILANLDKIDREAFQVPNKQPNVIHPQPLVNMFGCNICDKSFPTRRQLKYHHRLHANGLMDGQSLYECDVCDGKFNRSDHMVLHYRHKHAGIKPYYCKRMCGQRFDTAKEKTAHFKECQFVPEEAVAPTIPLVEIKSEFCEPTDTQEIDSMVNALIDDQLQNNVPPELPEFQSHFIKSEPEIPDDDFIGY